MAQALKVMTTKIAIPSSEFFSITQFTEYRGEKASTPDLCLGSRELQFWPRSF
jgi:hypothetical protein